MSCEVDVTVDNSATEYNLSDQSEVFIHCGGQNETQSGRIFYYNDFEQTTPGHIFHPGQLCRLCAKGTDRMVYIFSDSGKAHRIEEKINSSLPVTVRCDDQLPKQLCEDCVHKLDMCHEFAQSCIQAEEKLKLFSKENLFVSEVVGEPDSLLENDKLKKSSVANVTNYSCPLCCSGLVLVDKSLWQDSSCRSANSKTDKVTSLCKSAVNNNNFSDDTRRHKRAEHASRPVSSGERTSSATCRMCGSVLKDIEECLTHAKVHSTGDLFPCSMCDLCFSTEPSFLGHCEEHRRAPAEESRRPACRLTFHDEKAMAGHSCRRRFRRPDRGEAFRSEARLASHRQLHGRQSAATCVQCGEAFACENDLFEHARLVHAGEKAHRCTRCGKTFQLRARLVVHMRIHSGERPFECRLCGGRFYDNATLKGHLVTHLDVKPFKCDKCGRCFSRKTLFKNHVLSHDKATKPPLSKTYKCKFCPNVVHASYSKLVEHRKKVHPTETFPEEDDQPGISKPFACKYCEKSFAYRVTLVSHQRAHTGELPFHCEFCEKKFPLKRSLILHRRTHTGEKPYGCSTCGKRFIQSTHLHAHERVHTGEKPYACEACGEKFRLKNVRDAHCRKHTGERPFKCAVCEKTFRTSHAYHQHTWIHEDRKPYVCQYCGKAFRRSNGLKIHIRIHTGEKPYMCDVCGKCFTQKQDMKKHRNLHASGRL